MGHIQSMEFSSLNTGVSSRSLFQRIFPTQGSNQGLLHCRQILYQLNYQASPYGYVYYHVWGFCSHCVCSKLLPSTTQVPVEAGLRFEPVRADHGAHTITHCTTAGGASENESRSVMSDSLQPHGLCSPWNSPGQNTEVGSFSLLQRIFSTQGSNPCPLCLIIFCMRLSVWWVPRWH